MKIRILATLGLLALLAATSAFGQERMTLYIPFEFSAGTTVMPVGQYKVTQSSELGLVKLECYDRKVALRLASHPVSSKTARNESKLVFQKWGDSYFLTTVWSPSGVGSALASSKIQRESALLASRAPTSQVVLVARR